jgi:hypothetical protein
VAVVRKALTTYSADTDGDGLSDWEELNLGADGAETDPEDVDSDQDCVEDGEEFYKGTNPDNWDTDGDGLSDGPCWPPSKAKGGQDPLPLDNLPEVPDSLFVEISEMQLSNTPSDPEDMARLNLSISGKPTSFVVQNMEMHGKNAYMIVGSKHEKRDATIDPGDYSISLEHSDPECGYEFENQSHVTRLPVHFSGTQAGTNWNFFLKTYWRVGIQKDMCTKICPDDVDGPFEYPTLFAQLGLGHPSKMGLPTDVPPFVPPVGESTRYSFSVPERMLRELRDFEVPFAGTNGDKIDSSDNSVLISGKVKFSSAKFSHWKRIPPRITSTKGDGGEGETIEVRIGKKALEACSAFKLTLEQEVAEGKVSFIDGSYDMDIPSEEVHQFSLKGFTITDNQSHSKNDMHIEIVCKDDNVTIGHYDFTVCAHPRNMEMHPPGEGGFDIGMLGYGWYIVHRWYSDSGDPADLDLVRINEDWMETKKDYPFEWVRHPTWGLDANGDEGDPQGSVVDQNLVFSSKLCGPFLENDAYVIRQWGTFNCHRCQGEISDPDKYSDIPPNEGFIIEWKMVDWGTPGDHDWRVVGSKKGPGGPKSQVEVWADPGDCQ